MLNTLRHRSGDAGKIETALDENKKPRAGMSGAVCGAGVY